LTQWEKNELMAYDLFKRGVSVPMSGGFVEGVTMAPPKVAIVGGKGTSAAVALAGKFHSANFRGDWQKTTGSTDSGMAWLFGEDSN
jgi:hypothetical protein